MLRGGAAWQPGKTGTIYLRGGRMNRKKIVGYFLVSFVVVAICVPLLYLLSWAGVGLLVCAALLASITIKGMDLIYAE